MAELLQMNGGVLYVHDDPVASEALAGANVLPPIHEGHRSDLGR